MTGIEVHCTRVTSVMVDRFLVHQLNALLRSINSSRVLKTEESLRAFLQPSRLLVARYRHYGVIGMLTLTPSHRLGEESRGVITDLVVDPHFCRDDVASQLMTAAIRDAEQQGLLELLLVADAGLPFPVFARELGFREASLFQTSLRL